jgi:hypothetical protein
MKVDPQFSSPEGDIHGPVLIGVIEDGKSRGRRGEFIDFFSKGFDLCFGFLKSGDQLLILPLRKVQLMPGFMELPHFEFHGLNLSP